MLGGPERLGALAHALLNVKGEVAPGGCTDSLVARIGDLGPAQVTGIERHRW